MQTALLILLLITSAHANQDVMNVMDTNHDGVLSLSEALKTHNYLPKDLADRYTAENIKQW